MHLRHILAAADISDAGRHAARTAINLATRCSARLTIMRVAHRKAAPRHAVITIGTASAATENDGSTDSLRRWLETSVVEPGELGRIELRAAVGIPGVEICRFAECWGTDLVVLGRKRSSDMTRLLLGDTADAVARRSPVPTLSVPEVVGELQRVLVAMDGSPRGMMVLRQAVDLARYTGASLQVITVETGPEHENRQEKQLPVERSLSIQKRATEFLADNGFAGTQVVIRQGDVVETVTTHCLDMQADALVIGYHRGAAPSVLGPGSTAQRLGHAAPCAVLTVPL